ncbi:MAG TPA: Hpt domain-containing protein [Sphingomonas sp.]|jgi:HPt (histidine-containing phosphotransfer) domain-containing protein|uniref:Hpt domain-containing protein n=1 Tax=Sphingomonas sp. TaxID=28214 RepID=UPI002EDA8EF7
MAYDPGALEAALSAALGDDPALILEMQTAFLDSATAHVAALERAQLATEWTQAAWRLRGLAASFGAIELMHAADWAGEAPPRDGAALAAVRAAVA